MLESIILSDNPCQFTPILTIQAVGSIRLTSFNRESLLDSDIRTAFRLSPLVGYSLRVGRDPNPSTDELETTQFFLSQNLHEFLKSKNSIIFPKSLILNRDSTIELPLDGTNIKWMINCAPERGGWIPIPKATSHKILPITVGMRLHLIRCDFSLDGNRFSLFLDQPIGCKPRELSLPFPLDPTITGPTIEGSSISLFPLPVPVRVAWVRELETIAQDVTSITLSKSDVNHAIACLLQPHCPELPHIVFSTIFAATELIAPLQPIVYGISFPEHIMESKTIVFERRMIPDREGQSTIVIEKAISASSSEWIEIATIQSGGSYSYTPNYTDVGYFLRVAYTPITNDGTTGETVYFHSLSRVLASVPKFENPVIGGQIKTNHPLIGLADYSGGKKGNCIYNWYSSRSPINPAHGITSKLHQVKQNSQYFTPSDNLADMFLACLMIPVRSDEVPGTPVFAVTENRVVLEDPPKPIQDCPTEAIVHQQMRFPMEFDIMLSSTSGIAGFTIIKTSDSFIPREKHIGRILRIATEGYDVIIGEIKPSTPQILEVGIQATKWVIGETASISISHKFVRPDKVEIVWVRCGPNFEQVIAVDSPEYVLKPTDTDFSIKVIATPFDDDSKRLTSVSSIKSPIVRPNELIAPVLTGTFIEDKEITFSCPVQVTSVQWFRGNRPISNAVTYLCTNKDVGWQLRAELKLQSSGMIINVEDPRFIKPCSPSVELSFNKEIVIEGEIIKPNVVYHGGIEGGSRIQWFRGYSNDTWEVIHVGLQYQTTVHDVDCILRLVYTPIRNDGQTGIAETLEIGPIESKLPKVKKVSVSQNSRGILKVEGSYSGGSEGFSFMIWRVYEEGLSEPRKLGKSIDKELVVTPDLIGKSVDCVYVPVREDGCAGAPVPSINRIIVQPLPVVISAEILVKGGNLVMDSVIHCRCVVSKGATPKFQWERGDGTVWERIGKATGIEFIPKRTEVGFLIRCSIVAVDSKKWESAPFQISTQMPVGSRKAVLSIMFPGEKQEDSYTLIPPKSIVTGIRLMTNVPKDRQKSAELEWQREMKNQWITISRTPDYLISADDVGMRIRVVGKGGRISRPTNQIEFQVAVISHARAMTCGSTFRFKAENKFGGSGWQITANQQMLSMKSTAGTVRNAKWNTIQCECVPQTQDEMILYTDPSSSFPFIPNLGDDHRLETLVGLNNVRDFVVAALRRFVELYG
jgi:hypothetical protein